VRRTFLAAVLSVALAAGTAGATTYLLASPESMALEADLVFMGTVDSVTTEARDDRPWSLVEFGDLDVLYDREAKEKGQEPASQQSLAFLGGNVAGLPTLFVSGLPTFERGERWLVLARQDDGLASPVVGVSQGAWKFGPGGAQAGDGSYLSLDGSGALVRGSSSPTPEDLRAALVALLERGAPSAVGAPSEAGGPSAPPPPAAAGEDAAGTAPEPAPGQPPAAGDDAGDEAQEAAPETGTSETAPGEKARQTAAPEGEPEAAPTAQGQSDEATAVPAAPKTVRYRVDDRGGPLLLSSFASAAAGVWEAAAPGAVVFEADEAAPAQIRYGAPELMGPDAKSLTLASPGGRVEVLISPLVGDELEAVLVHELGVLAGLPEGGAGVMARTVSAANSAPLPADVAELRGLREFAPEDLDRSGNVDFYDLALFGRAYGTSGVNLAADFNGDGQVDDADLKLLREAYEFSPPQEAPPAAP